MPNDPNQRVLVKVEVMGKLMDIPCSPEFAAQYTHVQQQWEAKKQQVLDEAHAAMQLYSGTPTERYRKRVLQAIKTCSLYEGSATRLPVVLSLIEFVPPEIFWPAFMEAWSICDASWIVRSRSLRIMRGAGTPTAFLSRAQRKLLDALPAQVNVFRGCSRPRVRGVAWTTDRVVAEGFAYGHRGISVPDPVIASAIILKEHIFFLVDDRDEKEVVLDPRRLRKLVIEPYTTTRSQPP